MYVQKNHQNVFFIELKVYTSFFIYSDCIDCYFELNIGRESYKLQF